MASDGHLRHRARVVIEFFHLDDPERHNLHADRAMVLMALYPLLKESVRGSAQDRKKAREEVDGLLHPGLPHLNCALSFRRLFHSDPAEAEVIYKAARELVASKS